MTKKILIMAGGTGGHIFPGLAVAELLQQRSCSVAWLGTLHGMDTRLVPAAQIPYYQIAMTGLRGKGKLSLLLAPFKILKASFQAWKVMRCFQPDAVIGFGGYVTGPGAIAAKLCGIPVIVHEQNAIAGKTNIFLAHLAKKVLVAFPGAFSAKTNTQWVGNPVREAICQMAEPAVRFQGRQAPLKLLVFGGSQGAKAINETVLNMLLQLPKAERPMVWHQVGQTQLDTMRLQYQQHDIDVKLVPFIDNMAEAYAWADLVVCRAGALTVSELAAAGLPAVLVPFPAAVDDHQTANAKFLVDQDAAVLIQQRDLSPEKLVAIIRNFSNNPELLLTMAINARRVAKPDATQKVAEYCLHAGLQVAK